MVYCFLFNVNDKILNQDDDEYWACERRSFLIRLLPIKWAYGKSEELGDTWVEGDG